MNALTIAFRKGNVDTIKCLLNEKSLLQARKELEWTPLMHLSQMGLSDLIKTLIKMGEDVEEKGKGGGQPLIVSTCYGHLKATKALLDGGANPNIKYQRETPLGYAIEKRFEHILLLFAKYKGKFNSSEQAYFEKKKYRVKFQE